MNEYCKGCGMKLPSKYFMSDFLGGQKTYEFEEGTYCEKCAKLRVDKKRKEI